MHTIKIELDKPRKLKFDLNALATFEEETGVSCFSEETWKNIDATRLRALLWAALLHESPEMKLKEAGALVSLENMEYVSGKLMEAWQKATPEASEKKRVKPRK